MTVRFALLIMLSALSLNNVCSAQPPSHRGYILSPIVTFNPEIERRRLIECDERMIPIIEHLITSTEHAIQTFSLPPKTINELQDNLVKTRKLLVEVKERRQKLLDEEAREVKARPVHTPTAPMPRMKRYD